jgi:hypothetical protein
MKVSRYWWVGLVVVIIGTGLTCDITRKASFNKIAGQLPQAEADAKRLGLPLTGAELERNPPLKPEQNAAPLLIEATKLLKAATQRDSDWRKTATNALIDLDKASLADANASIDKLNPALELAERASTKPDLDFGRNWATANPVTMPYQELDSIKEIVAALGLRGALRAQRGNTQGAVGDFRASLRIARLVSKEPTAIDAMVRIALESLAFRAMEAAATFAPRNTEFLRSLDQLAAEQAANPIDFDRTLRAEVWSGVFLAGRTPKEIATDLQTAASRDGDTNMIEGYLLEEKMKADRISNELLARAYRSLALQAWVEFFDAKVPQESRLQRFERFEKWAEKNSSSRASVANLNEYLFLPYRRMGRTFARNEARPAAFRGLMAALQYRAKNGKFPPTLAECGFEGKDYFTGEPLKYIVEGDTVKVYSVDFDRRDDQGAEPAAGSQDPNAPRDIVVAFPRQIRSSRIEN